MAVLALWLACTGDEPPSPAPDPPTWAGPDRCATCHEAEHAAHQTSGHAATLIPVAGEAPAASWSLPEPHAGLAPEPPGDLTWDQVGWSFGGHSHKQRFLDADGFFVTGPAVQWNVQSGRWAAFEPRDDPKPFVCGSCHTTGFDPEGHQDGHEGLAGTWAASGVQCEACHGPGSAHVDAPEQHPLDVDASAEACRDCHVEESDAVLVAKDGFLWVNQQYTELQASTMGELACTDCHDAHQGSRATPAGVTAGCEGCHEERSAAPHAETPCTACHMPPMVASAESDAATWTGDLATHLFRVEPDPTAPQFSDDGTEAHPRITLDFACRGCHRDGGEAAEQDDTALAEEAVRVHGVR